MSCGDESRTGHLLSPSARARILEQLFRSEALALTRYLRSRIGRDDDVQDLLQESFARLAGAKSSALMDRPQAYLQRIARNLVVDRFRRREKQSSTVHIPVDEAIEMSSAPQQEWAIEARDVAERYEAVLMTLPERTQRIFLLNRKENLSYRELATREGISVKAVEYHISRALTQLHKAFYTE